MEIAASEKLSGALCIGGAGYRFLRRKISLTARPQQALLYVAADPHTYARDYWMPPAGLDSIADTWLPGGSFLKYRFFLNGAFAAAGPYRAIVDGSSVLHCFDLTTLFTAGENVLAAITRGESCGFAAALHLTMPDGSVQKIVSDDAWKELDASAFYPPVCWERQAVHQFFKGYVGPGEFEEHLDGRAFPWGWERPWFDDASWGAAQVHGAVPWPLEASEMGGYELCRVTPQQVTELRPGRWVIDFNRICFAGIELIGPEAGGAVELRLGEELNANGSVMFQMRTQVSNQEIWRFPAGSRRLAHFGMRTFRYAEVIGYPGFTAEKITAAVLSAPLGNTRSLFRSSDERLNRVWKLCADTILTTSADLYNDSMTRERVAYEADDYINMLTDFATVRNLDLARRTIRYQMNHVNWPTEWRQFIIPLVYEYVLESGDLAFAAEQYPRLAAEFTDHRLAAADGLIPEIPERPRIIVDWPRSQRDDYEFGPCNTVVNAFAAWDLQNLGTLAGWLGKTADAAAYRKLAAEMADAMQKHLTDPATGLFVDCRGSNHSSVHANLFPLAFGLVPEAQQRRIADYLAERGMVCSVYAAQFMLEALFRARRGDAAVAMMVDNGPHSWLNMLSQGAVATCEGWSPADKPNMSFSHPWGSAPGNQTERGIFGLRATAPGWEEYVFDPQPGCIAEAELIRPAARGTFHARFRMENGRLSKELNLK